MTSIFRKLTRRKKAKQTLPELPAGISTESSQASEFDLECTKRPLHHLKPSNISENVFGKHVDLPQCRSSSRSHDRSVAQKNNRSETPPRNGLGPDVDCRAQDPSEGKAKRHRFSFLHASSHNKVHTPACATYDSEEELPIKSITTPPLKRGRKPVPVNTGSYKCPQVKVVRVQKRQMVSLKAKEQLWNGTRPLEAAVVLPPLHVTVPARAIAEETAKHIATSRETERIARAATALDNRGNEYFEKGYYDKAMDAYTRALKLKRRTFHSMLEEADDLFDEALENEKLDGSEKDVDPKLLVSMATSINNIGYLRQRSGEATPDETMAAYKKSLRIKRKILGNDSLSVGKTLNNIGSVYYLKKEFEGALPAYEEALNIMQSNLGADHPDVATVISNMGDVCLAMKKPEESLTRYRAALNIRWNAFGEKDPRTMRLLEKIARIEIGDKMPTPRGTKMERQNYDWDESELYDLDLRPISLELRLLRDQVKEDIQQVDLLEKKIAIGMVRDKVKIVKGMRELIEAQERGHSSFNNGLEGSFSNDSSHRDDDTDDLLYSPVMFAASSESRDDAQARVQERLAKLRIQKGLDPAGPRLPFSELSSMKTSQGDVYPRLDPSQSNFLRSALYATGNQSRTALSSLRPEEIKEKVEDIESALKLKKGIDNLRALGECSKYQVKKSMVGTNGESEVIPSENCTGELALVENETCVEVQPQSPLRMDGVETRAKIAGRSVGGSIDDVDDASVGKTDDIREEESLQQFTSRPMENFAPPKMVYATWLGEIEG